MRKLINSLKFFINRLDYLIGNTLFCSQSQFSNILIDELFSSLFFLSSKFKIIQGNEKSQIIINTEKLEKLTRGNSKAKFSSSYIFKFPPKVFHSIIKRNIDEINNYLGKNFLFEKAICFRNYHYPAEFSNYDIFSNIWHQDSHDGNRLIKIFVLVEDVNLEDGPFHYLQEKDVKKHWPKLRERWTWDKFQEKPHFEEQKILTGKKYDYLVLDSSRCMHRASNPEKFRDLIQITLYPRWRKKQDREKFIL